MTYVQKLFKQLGDCTYQLDIREGHRNRLTITAPVGRLLEYWGVPVGDKHLHPEYRLPLAIRSGTKETKQAYLTEVIPEDGFFVNRAGIQKFGIKRAQILDAGDKNQMYDFQPKLTPQHKNLIQQYGTQRTHTIRDDKPRQVTTLTKGQLRKISKNAKKPNDQRIAKQLQSIIKDNPCQLLQDEIQIAQSLGIQMTSIFKELKLHTSGRVSAIWEAYTKRELDTFQWAQLAPPASNPKFESVKKWLQSHLKLTKEP